MINMEDAMRKLGYIFSRDNELGTVFRKGLSVDDELIVIDVEALKKWITDHKYDLENPEMGCINTVINVQELLDDLNIGE